MTRIVGLIDVDYKIGRNINNTPKKFPNLALMKISAYYKSKGYKVEWFTPVFRHLYYKIFASKVFSWKSPYDRYIDGNVIKGGSGYDLKTKLPDKIEHICPDYSLYGIDYAMGFITRGCNRNCKWCIVTRKEGRVHKHADLDEFWYGQKRIMLMDNNILAYEDHITELKNLIDIGCQVQFNQGLDIRLINEENAKLIKEIKRWKGHRIHFAFDDIRLKNIIEEKLELLFDIGFKPNDFMFYVLIGFNSTIKEDLERIYFLKNKKIRAYISPYNPDDLYQKVMKRYVNFKPFFWKMNWNEFLEHDNHSYTNAYRKLLNF